MKRYAVPWLLGVAAVAVGVLAGAGSAAAAPPYACEGSPGSLAGNYPSNVVVRGVCVVDGPTSIGGNLILLPGSALLAFPDFDVAGNVVIQRGATLVGGVEEDAEGAAAQPQTSVFHVGGNVTANRALGVVLHGTAIDGNIVESGGGGGFTCEPSGIFALFESPVFSVVEGSHVGGGVTISGLTSCWLGITHSRIDGGVRVLGNQLADPDAIEILDNAIGGNLVCQGNSMLWDSADTVEGALFPRFWEPNTVGGHRVGQCVVAPPLTEGGLSPGPF